MIFEINKFQLMPDGSPDATGKTHSFQWTLLKASGEAVARGPRVFYDEKECRSQIAEAKKSMKGAMRCKVVTLDARP
jgi:hypothetical protein